MGADAGLTDVYATFSNVSLSKKQRQAKKSKGIAGQYLNSKQFMKMLKNAKFVGKFGKKYKKSSHKIQPGVVDTEFAEYCKKGMDGKEGGTGKSTKKELHYDDFVIIGVPQLSDLLKLDPEDFCARLCQNGKPKLTGVTKVDKKGSKFYDDKSTWTGVATRGGPSTVDNNMTLSTMCDRSPADVRGLGSNKGTKGPGAY